MGNSTKDLKASTLIGMQKIQTGLTNFQMEITTVLEIALT
jgi:hypothetical protein